MKYILLLAGLLLTPFPAFPFLSPKLNPYERPPSRLYKEALNDIPNIEIGVHTVGNVWMTVTNIGQFGTGYLGALLDPVTQQPATSCIFPANSKINYLYVGAFWIGAVVGRDTLVSIGVDDYYSVIEFWPDPAPRGEIVRRSIQSTNPFYSRQAVSEQDIIAVYTDTLTDPGRVNVDATDGRPHIPLNIEVSQRSYAWSYDYASDFILFDYSIKNIGRKLLDQVYMSVYVDGDVHHTSIWGDEAYGEDLCGFKRAFPSGGACNFIDTIKIAYIMDNDGDPTPQFTWSPTSARGAAGVRVERTPSDSLSYSFNWWITNYNAATDFGPRRAGTPEDPFRDMNGILGTPLGDRNKYYVMRHQEFDYDQLFTGMDQTAEGWLPQPENAAGIAKGGDARYLLSFGPFNIHPGEVLPITFAWVCGDNVHVGPKDFLLYFNSSQPQLYYNKLDFSDLALNSRWASWVYDNPGYDTDGDGYKGKYRICALDSTFTFDTIQIEPPVIETSVVYLNADTLYYEGDGVPDFRGASPPPPPVLRIFPRINAFNEGELRVRWSGLRSETERDVFSNRVDFEGYRVYQSLAPGADQFVMISSYDRDDYNRYIWIRNHERYELRDIPFTLDSIRTLYGDSFDPLRYDRDNPFYWKDSAFYFARQGWNQSDLTDTNLIHKLYPDAPYPTTLNVDSARLYHPEELTEAGYFKYFEYEYTLKHLLPSQLYYIAVTAFDYGSPGSGLDALETAVSANMVAEYPQNQTSRVESGGLKVVVYPNPYRIDGNYRDQNGGGFEGRGNEDLPDDRVRRIHFTNLPHKCKIKIFTIDGDLVREINHDYAPNSPRSMHDEWDLITRNTQAAVSGIYYYSVESEYGNQLGKIVIIM